MRNLRRRLNKGIKGFTLVELLVVIAIIAILSVTAYVALGGQTAKARNARRQQDLATIQNAVQLYAIENNNYVPANLDALVPKFMPKLPLDPSAPKGTTLDYDQDNNTTQTPAFHYAYAANSKTFLLGTTLEDEEDLEAYESYVVGNASSSLIEPTQTPNGTCGDANVPIDPPSTDCAPVAIW